MSKEPKAKQPAEKKPSAAPKPKKPSAASPQQTALSAVSDILADVQVTGQFGLKVVEALTLLAVRIDGPQVAVPEVETDEQDADVEDDVTA